MTRGWFSPRRHGGTERAETNRPGHYEDSLPQRTLRTQSPRFGRAMDLFVVCECGNRCSVSSSLCGQDVICSCGKLVLVPRLTDLRASNGLSPFVSVSDRIRALESAGRLPVEDRCVVCQTTTEQTLHCAIECERPVGHDDGAWKSFFSMFLFGPLVARYLIQRDSLRQETRGHELVVVAPMRICDACFRAARLTSEKCKELLRTTEVYRELLDEYPDAQVIWSDTLGERLGL